MVNGHRPRGRHTLTFPHANGNCISADDVARMVAILDRMLDLALSLDWLVDGDEFVALQHQLAVITGAGSAAAEEGFDPTSGEGSR